MRGSIGSYRSLAAALALGGLCVVTVSACATTGTTAAQSKAPRVRMWEQPVIDTLVKTGQEDQLGREDVARAVTAGDTAVVLRMLRADSARSRWLKRTVAERGWPVKSRVGASASTAAWLILQHSPLNDWQDSMRVPLDSLANAGEISRAEAATFTDRVLVHQKKPQLYGTQFDIIGGKLVPSPIADLKGLDQRRATVGLPPINEYVKMLGEAFKVPVVWPPPGSPSR